MAEEIYSSLLVGAGIVGLFFSVKALRNPTFARMHVETSPKVWLWRKYFGVEKALIMTKKIFLPLGIVISLGLIVVGILFLIV